MGTNTEKMIKDYYGAWNSHDVDGILSYFTDDCVYEDLAFGVINHGKKELKDFFSDAFATMPDLRLELKSLFFSGDWVGHEWAFPAPLSRRLRPHFKRPHG